MSSSNPHLPHSDPAHDPDTPAFPSSRHKPPGDLYLSLADIADLSQQIPASPRHQRIHTLDHPPDTPVRLTSARFAGASTRPSSVDSPLRPGFEPLPSSTYGLSSQNLDPAFAIRDLDQYVTTALFSLDGVLSYVYTNLSIRVGTLVVTPPILDPLLTRETKKAHMEI